LLIPLATLACLATAYFAGPQITGWLGIFGKGAAEVYELAPDLVASENLSQVFSELGIPGVKVYVIPLKDQSTQGAFIILDASAGYQGLNPLEDKGDLFMYILQDIIRRDRAENLRLSHVTVEFRDEVGESAFAFTAQQALIAQYADGLITRDEFFGSIEIDLLNTLKYLGIDSLLEEIQP
jgi:hypothetical protein